MKKYYKYILVGCVALATVVVWSSVGGNNQPANAETSDYGITIKLSEAFLTENMPEIMAIFGGELAIGAATRYPTGYLDTADGYYVDGTAIIDADGNVDGAITSSTGTFSSTLTVSGAFVAEAASTLTGTSTITASYDGHMIWDDATMATGTAAARYTNSHGRMACDGGQIFARADGYAPPLEFTFGTTSTASGFANSIIASSTILATSTYGTNAEYVIDLETNYSTEWMLDSDEEVSLWFYDPDAGSGHSASSTNFSNWNVEFSIPCRLLGA